LVLHLEKHAVEEGCLQCYSRSGCCVFTQLPTTVITKRNYTLLVEGANLARKASYMEPDEFKLLLNKLLMKYERNLLFVSVHPTETLILENSKLLDFSILIC